MPTLIALALSFLTACAAPSSPRAVVACAEAGQASVLAAREAAAVYVVTPRDADVSLDAPLDFEEALERAERRARQGGAGDEAFGGRMAFDVVRTLKGTAPTRLALPVPGCTAPAYLVLIGPDGTDMIGLTGTDDQVLDQIAGR